MKKIFGLLLFAVTSLFIACTDDITEPKGETNLVKLEADTVLREHTVSIIGEFMGINPVNSYILLGDMQIDKDKILSWNHSRIDFTAPDTFGLFTLKVVLGKDTTNTLNLYIRQIPIIEFSEVYRASYNMGSNNGLDDEQPVHQIALSNSLICSKYEISQKLYKDVCGTNPSEVIDYDYPVNNVSFGEALVFCNKLSEIHGLEKCYTITASDTIFNYNANGYRLPTEAEWEYICRSETAGDYSGSDINTLAWYNANSGFQLHKSGLKQPNPFGIYDLHGNLSEWCWDLYDAQYYQISESQNPTGPSIGSERVIRGGNYESGTSQVRSSSRDKSSDKSKLIGFRIVRNK